MASVLNHTKVLRRLVVLRVSVGSVFESTCDIGLNRLKSGAEGNHGLWNSLP